MVYFKKNENDKDERFTIPDDFLFDGIVIVGDLERSEKMKGRNAFKAVAVIFAVCAALAAAVFAKSRSEKKSEV